MPSIWADAPDEHPTGAASQEQAESGPNEQGQGQEDTGLKSNQRPNEQGRNEQGSLHEEESKLESQIRLPPRVRQQFGGALRTTGDAYQVCKALFDEQLDRAMESKPLPNQSITGDSSARTAFLLLLNDSQQRRLFLEFASRPVTWPRIKPLIGSPPFHFLMPQDAGVLNAAGFSRGRINMTYDSAGSVANHHQFGPGQMVDQHTREYRVSSRSIGEADPLPGAGYFHEATKDIVLQVKVKRHGIQKKRELFHSEFKKQLFFPQPGEEITLSETHRMMGALGLKVPSRTTLRVKAVWPKCQGASTAAVLVGM